MADSNLYRLSRHGLSKIPENINDHHSWRFFLDRYNLIGTVGRGTYGRVILASRKSDPDSNLLALKVIKQLESVSLKDGTTRELHILGLIAQEASCAENWSSPGSNFLQSLLEGICFRRALFLVLEYHPATLCDPEVAPRFILESTTSRQGLALSISLPLVPNHQVSLNSNLEKLDCLRLLSAEIVLGLLFLHHHGIVHQDIKPANILISYAGHVVIGDFGAANCLPPSSQMTISSSSSRSLVQVNNRHAYGPIVSSPDSFVTFTPLYAAPEMRERDAENRVVYDERADWWSFGVLLHELATGRVPFVMSQSFGSSEHKFRTVGDSSLAFGQLERLCTLRNTFTADDRHDYADLEDFVRSLLVENPDERLTDENIRSHPFFGPIAHLWEEIAALRYPPCPDLPVSRIVEDASGSSLLSLGLSDMSISESPCTIDDSGVAFSPTHQTCASFTTPEIANREIHDVFGIYSNPREAQVTPSSSANTGYWGSASDVQALPSSASIWHGYPITPTITITLNDKMPSTSSGDLAAARELSLRRNPWSDISVSASHRRRSVTISRRTRAKSLSGLSSPTPKPKPSMKSKGARTVAWDENGSGLQEQLTISLLKAMEARDMQVIAARSDFASQRQARWKVIAALRRVSAMKKRGVLRRLQFWR